ncbi:predicted protein [Nematostella vectensis]|uniref:Uncharacterized protein n=1 Tax=Nematostella vectensis TaxID=45351 RepID=A7RP52_NEMVE|nr:uncharacterized protein LOC5518938 [Nematostella vectensis]EDO46795.1 predicted protein [Nematostella vectensis]|eukprot:XP_001638858.1 predicted protein [Nematostella vectensis]
MASLRRGATSSSRIVRQVVTASRMNATRISLARVAACLPAIHRNASETNMVKQAHQKYFSSFPKFPAATIVSLIPTIEGSSLEEGGSGSSEVLESPSGEDEGLVTPAAGVLDDL